MIEDRESATEVDHTEAAPVATEAQEAQEARGRRKVRTGVVVSDKMEKTVLVRVEQVDRHPVYGKIRRRSSKLAAHDESNDAHVGDRVRVMETRPMSKSKRWRVIEVLDRAK